MTRPATTALLNALAADAVEPFFAVKLEFDSGTTRIWTGMGDLAFDAGSGSETFLGGSSLVSIQPNEETADTQANGCSFALNGIESANISLALTEDYQGRNATLFLGAFSSSAVVADPYVLFKGFMDTMDISDNGETASIQVKAESRLVSLQKARMRRFTDQDQKLIDSTDKGLEYVVSLQNKTIAWGSGKPDNNGAPTLPNIGQFPLNI
tara:strand:+ start:489 stop:1118 length:630 start_codon:yes stop_codon:yes gene_type:complete